MNIFFFFFTQEIIFFKSEHKKVANLYGLGLDLKIISFFFLTSKKCFEINLVFY